MRSRPRDGFAWRTAPTASITLPPRWARIASRSTACWARSPTFRRSISPSTAPGRASRTWRDSWPPRAWRAGADSRQAERRLRPHPSRSRRAGVERARAAIGTAEIRLDGTLGSGGKLRGTDVRFEVRAGHDAGLHRDRESAPRWSAPGAGAAPSAVSRGSASTRSPSRSARPAWSSQGRWVSRRGTRERRWISTLGPGPGRGPRSADVDRAAAARAVLRDRDLAGNARS